MAHKESLWWQRGLFQAPRAVVSWDHTDENRMSRGVAEEGRKVTWSELFFDLVFVTLISRLGEAYQEGHSSLLQIFVMFRVLIGNWIDIAIYNSRFFTDDVPCKLIHGAQMFLLIMAGMKLKEDFEESAKNFLYFSGMMHLFDVLPYLRVMYHLREYRTFVLANYVVPSLVKGAYLIALSHGDPRWYTAGMSLLIFATIFHTGATFRCSCMSFKKANRIPVHLEHLIERRGCLRLIVLGEVITGVTVDPTNVDNTAICFILLGFLLVFNMKLLAFDVDIVHVDRHAARAGGPLRTLLSVEADHLFDASIAALGSCVKLVLTVLLHDSREDADGQESGSQYVFEGVAHILLCGAVAVGLCALLISRLSHIQDYELREMDAEDIMDVPDGLYLTESEALTANYGSIQDVEKVHHQPKKHNEKYNVRLAKAIFYIQMVMQVCTILMVVGLGVYCESIEADYEFLLVLTALWVLTSILIAVNLLDEALLF